MMTTISKASKRSPRASRSRSNGGAAPPLPATMRAAAISRFGPPKVLSIHTLPVPTVGANEVLIALHTSGIGVWDADIRSGWWPEGKPTFPLVLGTDGAGTVVAKGAKVRRFRAGDRVWAYEFINPKGGFYAEYVAVNADHAYPVPAQLDLYHAGAATVTALTALQGVDDHLAIRRGETVLIFGATGAVGTLAVQFAKRRNARVLATASRPKSAAVLRQLGADGVFDPRKKNAADELRALAPDGIDAVLALVGGNSLEQCLDQVRRGGRVAFPNGVEPAPRARPKVQVRAYDGVAGPREFARLSHAVKQARLTVPIAAAFPLAQAAKAHERLERGGLLGRIALRIRRE